MKTTYKGCKIQIQKQINYFKLGSNYWIYVDDIYIDKCNDTTEGLILATNWINENMVLK